MSINTLQVIDNNTIVVTDGAKQVLYVNTPGPQGPTGPQGPSGSSAGTVDTGSLLTTSSFNSWTGSTTSQFSGTSSYATTASYAMNGGGSSLSGGTDTYIPLWSGSTALTSSFLNQSNDILKTTSASADVGLKLDFPNGQYILGDNTDPNYQTYVVVNGGEASGNSNLQLISVDNIVTSDINLTIDGTGGYLKTAYNDNDAGLRLDFLNNEYWIGSGPINGGGTLLFDADQDIIKTYFGVGNETGIYVTPDIAVLGDFSGYSGNWMAVKTDQGNKQVSIGTYSSDLGNGTRLVVDDRDGVQKVSITGSLDVGGSVNITNGNLGLQYKFVDLTSTGNYVITDNSAATVYRFSNASSTSYNVELPPASTCLNRIYWISRSNDGIVTGEVTLQCSSNIEDNVGNFNPFFNIGENAKFQWISDGSQWIMISG
jgi:hypothetical protein